MTKCKCGSVTIRSRKPRAIKPAKRTPKKITPTKTGRALRLQTAAIAKATAAAANAPNPYAKGCNCS